MGKTKGKVIDRIIAVFLTVIMLFGMMPVSIFAVEDETTTIEATTEESTTEEIATVESTTEESTTEKNTTTTEPELLKTFKVNVVKNDGGTVSLNGNNVDSITADENSEVTYSVSADNGYAVSFVKLGDKTLFEGLKQTIDTEKFTLLSDTTITVNFVEIHTVSVKYDSEEGSAKIDSNSVNTGDVTLIKKGGDFIITATPKDKSYRVESVMKNNVPVKDFVAVNGKGFTETVTAVNEDYEYDIVFAPNQYKVTVAEELANGNITVEKATVSHGESIVVTVKPDDGYDIEEVTVNGKEIQATINNNYEFNLTVVENVELSASFVKYIVSSDLTKVSFSPEAKIVGNKYYYQSGTAVTVKASDSSFSINLNEEKSGLLRAYKAYYTINNDFVITAIKLRKNVFNTEEIKLPSGGINIKFDGEVSEAVLRASELAEGLTCYSEDVKFDVSANDDLSGVAKVYYTIQVDGGTESARVEINDWSKENDITIKADDYNQKTVTVKLYVEDNVGNVKTDSKTVKINKTAPSYTWSWGETLTSTGKVNGEEDGVDLYNKKRTLKINFTDWEKSFVEKNVATVKVETTNPDGSTSTQDILPIFSDKTATYYLNYDGEYSIAFGDYSNAAGVIFDSSELPAIDNFRIDTTPADTKISINESLWDKLVEKLNFKTTLNYEFDVKIEANDLNGVEGIYYYDSGSDVGIPDLYTGEKTLEEKYEILNAVSFAEYTDGLDIKTNQRNVIYAKTIDHAGNVIYVSTDGFILDMNKPVITFGNYPEGYNNSNYYGVDYAEGTFELEITANENSEVSSGIKKISYWVTTTSDKAVYDSNNAEHKVDDSQKKVLYTFGDDYSLDRINEAIKLTKTISEKYSKINGECVVFHVEVEDNAGSVVVADSQPVIVNTTAPVIDVEWENTEVDSPLANEDDMYYSGRVATITITDMPATFDKDKVTFAFNAENKGASYVDPNEITWNLDKQTATVTFKNDKTNDAKYNFTVNYTNEANSKAEQKTYSFTIDNTDPTGSVTVDGTVWDKFLSIITFGIYSKKNEVVITASGSDVTSPNPRLKYFIDYEKTVLRTWDELNEIEFEEYSSEEKVSADEHFVVYLKIIDLAGNYIYVNSDGYVVDNDLCFIDLIPFDDNKPEGEKIAAELAKDTYGYFNAESDVKVKINVAESTTDYSGIKKIYYSINDGEEKVLYSFEPLSRETNKYKEYSFSDNQDITDENIPYEIKDNLTYENLKKSWEGIVNVDKSEFNSSNTKFNLRVIDNAGNETLRTITLDIDITAPVIDVKYNETENKESVKGFYTSRIANVSIRERANHFSAEEATKDIVIKAREKDSVEYSIELKAGTDYVISEWTSVLDQSEEDGTLHKATVEFLTDNNYEFIINYTDIAGNSAVEYNEKFTKDTTKPDFGEITAESKEGRAHNWGIDYFKDLSIVYGFWSKELITVTAEASDATSPIQKIEYYKHITKSDDENRNVVLTREDLDNLDKSVWISEEKVEFKPNVQGVVYAKITDNAGNYIYVNTNGLIVDDKKPGEVLAPETTLTPEQPINGFYNDDVKVSVDVMEPVEGDTYSGLKSITYRIMNITNSADERITKEGTLFSTESGFIDEDVLLNSWKGDIIVDSELNNSNRVVVEVTATDNSGNFTVEYLELKIDTTVPAIDVKYNNNSVLKGKFFKANREATVIVSERNFDPEKVVIDITNTDEVMPKISEWEKKSGTGNGDDTKWVAKISYVADGDYTFGIKCEDIASNKNSKVNYGNSVAPTEFTLDKTLPRASVSYNNNSAKNGKYFNSSRTATITIVEHNFDLNSANLAISANLDSKAISKPKVSWSHNDDTHIATIDFIADGDYTFNIAVSDKAGNKNKGVNYGNPVAVNDFTIDKTPPTLKITGVANGKAYKGAAEPTISFSDTNYDNYDVRILRTRMGDKNAVVTNKFAKKIPVNAKGGTVTFNTFKEIAENDGIYTLTVEVIDKAGNRTPETVKFTLNRFGSVYEYSDYLVEKIEEIYTKSIDKDLVITEYNADRLLGGSLNIEVTCDGKPLSDVKYEVSPVINETVAVGSSGWFQYAYTISKDNFESDGVYKIFVSSEDATGNKPENSNYEDKAITFMVDSTAPEITSITGLEEAIVNATEQEVKYTIFDTIGLKSIKIIVDGVQIGNTITDFSADMNNYSGSFKLTEKTTAQTIQLVVEDTAGNITDTDSETFTSEYVFNSKATVSTNFFVRWYANKGLFFGSIAGFIALVAAIIFIVVKRRKKDEE